MMALSRRWCILFVLGIVGCQRTPETSQGFVRQTIISERGFIEQQTGNLPLILAVPHGGYLKPTDIPDRNCPGCSYAQDTNTQELARLVDSLLKVRTSCYAHLVINRLHRVKMDANRDLAEAASSNPTAAAAWQAYTSALDQARASVTTRYGKGLLIDLHGHGHTIQRLELGYLLTEEQLRRSDDELLRTNTAQQSSVRALSQSNAAVLSFGQLLRGSNSLGSIFQRSGYPAVPSTQLPAALVGEPYFNGGYTTARFGSLNGGSIDAVQVEANFKNVRDTPQNLLAFAQAFVASVDEFMRRHYFGKELAEICK